MMKQFLESQGLNYKEVNVQTDPVAGQKLVEETGQMGVPQTNINGHWVLGFDPEEIMKYVKK